MKESNVFVVLHNVSSVSKCTEFIRIANGLGYKNLIISRAQSSAAQSGVPSAQKMALQEGLNFFVLQDLTDVIDVLQPDKVLLFAPRPYAKDRFDYNSLADEVKQGKKIVLVFGGSDPGLARKELDLGTAVHVHTPKDTGSLGTLTIALYDLARTIG